MNIVSESGQGASLFDNAVLVVAHPDDEMLWFSSILRQVDKIVTCLLNLQPMPALGAARAASLCRHPLAVVNLGVDESDAFRGADWEAPVLTEYGIAVPRRPQAAEKYRSNYAILRQRLRQELAGCEQVFTHNPWGEYGHEEHVQIHRVVKDLQRELRFRLWYGNYCSDKSYALMLQHSAPLTAARITLKTDRALAERIRKVYQADDCWTWFPDWRGAEEESFIAEEAEAAVGPPRQGVFPLNFMRIGRPAGKKPGLLQRIFG